MQVNVKMFLIVLFELLFLESYVMPRDLLVTIAPFTKLFYRVHFSFLLLMACEKGHHYWIILRHEARWPLGGLLLDLAHYQTFIKTITWAPNCIFPSLCGAFEWDYSQFWPPFHPINPNWAKGQNVKVQALKSIKDFSKHREFLGLHPSHIWLMHFGCANGFLKLCHTFFGQGFISRHGAYRQYSSPRRHPGYFGIIHVLLPSCLFWRVSTKELCKYIMGLG
jgi:hypothetical protein